MSEVYDALKEAGAGEEKARAAAAIAGYENRFAKIGQELAVITRMAGFNLALTTAVLWKVFSG